MLLQPGLEWCQSTIAFRKSKLNGVGDHSIQHDHIEDYFAIQKVNDSIQDSSSEGYIGLNVIECYKTSIIAFEGCLKGIQRL